MAINAARVLCYPAPVRQSSEAARRLGRVTGRILCAVSAPVSRASASAKRGCSGEYIAPCWWIKAAGSFAPVFAFTLVPLPLSAWLTLPQPRLPAVQNFKPPFPHLILMLTRRHEDLWLQMLEPVHVGASRGRPLLEGKSV